MSRKPKKRNGANRKARIVRFCAVLIALAVYATAGEWFVHHPRAWLDRYEQNYSALAAALEFIGNPVADITDSIGLTGIDCVYEYDTPAPSGAILFAGTPRRNAAPAPDDIKILNRGEYIVGWSDSLGHPAWVAYHVTKDARYEAGKRPNFSRDVKVDRAPSPGDYKNSGYDRGHMAPNYAIATRYGEAAQRSTFLMTNISPQTAELNRGPWRNMEHRIADYWTSRYGEIWVIVGSISPSPHTKSIAEGRIDVPQSFYMVVVAQEEYDVRALAVVLPQTIAYDAYPARYLVSIDDLEELTGLDFLPDLPEFISSPLESQLPTRLWPIRLADIIPQIVMKYSKAF